MEEQRQEIGNGFSIPKSDCKYLKKHKLLGKGELHFFNELSDILVHGEKTMPQKEWLSLKVTLLNFMREHREGDFFDFLVMNYKPEEINYNAYQIFLFHNSHRVKVAAFRVMPTEHLEEFAHSQGNLLFRYMSGAEVEEFMQAIEQRNDTYGGLPREFIHEILMPEAHIPPMVNWAELRKGLLNPFTGVEGLN